MHWIILWAFLQLWGRDSAISPVCELSNTVGIKTYPRTPSGMTQLFADIVASGKSPWDTPALYVHLGRDAHNTQRLLARWYPQHAEKILALLKVLPQEHSGLLLHPGIAARFTEFEKFAKDFVKKSPKADAWELKEAFSKSLGTRKVYRGLMLTSSEAQSIAQNGLEARGLMDKNKAVDALTDAFNPDDKSSATDSFRPVGALWARTRPKVAEKDTLAEDVLANSIAQSVTEYPLVADSAASYAPSTQDGSQAGKSLYRITLELPELDIIKSTGLFKDTVKESRRPFILEGKDYGSLAENPGLEQFVFFNVGPTAIEKVERIDTKPPKLSFGPER